MPRARSAVAGVVCCEMRCEGCPSTGTARPSTATGSCIENPSRGRSCRQMRSNRFLSHFTSGRFLLYDAEFSAALEPGLKHITHVSDTCAPQVFFQVTAAHMCFSEAVTIYLAVLSLIHISEPTRLGMISYAVFCLKKK